MRWGTAAAILLCAALSGSSHAAALTVDERVNAAAVYLERAYNKDVGLVRESLQSGSLKNVYWLNDNAFAAIALRDLGLQRQRLGQDIEHRMTDFARTFGLEVRLDGFVRLGTHEVVGGYRFDIPLECPRNFEWRETTSGIQLKYTVWDNDYAPPALNPAGWELRVAVPPKPGCETALGNYADFCLYAALSEHLGGRSADARRWFDQAIAKWDGVGFVDDATPMTDGRPQHYATFKAALVLLVAHELSIDVPATAQAKKALDRLSANGAPQTEYDRDLRSLGLMNVETTALTLLALHPPNLKIQSNAGSSPGFDAWLSIVAVAFFALGSWRRTE